MQTHNQQLQMEAKHKMVFMYIQKHTHMRDYEGKSIQLFAIKHAR